MKNAVIVFGRNLVTLHQSFRQAEGAGERLVAELFAGEVLLLILLLMLVFLFSINHQHVVVQLYLEVLLTHARSSNLQFIGLVCLPDIDSRN